MYKDGDLVSILAVRQNLLVKGRRALDCVDHLVYGPGKAGLIYINIAVRVMHSCLRDLAKETKCK
jgi:hypothetical protein